jgi:hypothetical protein
LFPRDPAFAAKVGPILDLDSRRWRGHPFDARNCVLSADEKTSIQTRRRIHPSRPPQPGRPSRIEHEYERLGAGAYVAAWDVRRVTVFGRCEPKTGIAAFDRLVAEVMSATLGAARNLNGLFQHHLGANQQQITLSKRHR